MTFRSLLCGSIVFGTFGFANAPSADEPATTQTANLVWNKVEKLYAEKSDLKGFSTIKLSGEKVSRTEFVTTMSKVFDHYKPSVRSTPRPFRLIPEYLDTNKDAAVKEKLRELIRWGFVAPAGPLVTGGETLSAEEVGDALGYFYVQLKVVTYQPDPKWTASLAPL